MRELLLARTGWNDAELASRMRKKQDDFAGLLTDDGAIELLARENGLQVDKPVAFNPTPLASAMAGDTADFLVRALAIPASRSFSTQNAEGEVCNVAITDGTTAATLVLWNRDARDLVDSGKIERNDLLEIRNALVKNASPLEIHARLTTEITVANDRYPSTIQVSEVPLVTLDCAESPEFDSFARILQKGDVREFQRAEDTRRMASQPKKSFVLNLSIADASGQKNLVLWDKNALIGSRAKVGDAVKLESAYSRNAEINLSGKGRLIINPRSHSLETREQLYSKNYPRKTINELAQLEGGDYALEATLSALSSGQRHYKCACGRKNQGETCECGQTGREIILAIAELSDETSQIRCAFFGSEAKTLLGVRDFTLPLETILSLKRDYLAGKKILLIVSPKHNSFSNKTELTARHILSLS